MKKTIIKNVLSILVVIITILSIQTMISLNVLPVKYLWTFIISECLLLGLGIVLYNLKRKIWFILGILFLLLSLIGNSFLYYYLNKTNRYINENFAIETYKVKVPYYVITSFNNNVNGLEEIDNNTTIYYYEYSRAIQEALKKLGKHNYKGTNIGYETLEKVLSHNLYLIISKADFDFIIDASNEMESSQFNIINEFEVLEEVNMNISTPDAYSIYVNGLDYSGNRRDYNLIATINTKTHKIVLTSIPRDFYIYVPAYGLNDSLTALGTVDPEISKEALESLFNTKIDYTLNLYTESLVKIVDTIGGVDFCSNTSFYTTHDLTLGSYDDYGEKLYVSKGCRTYNGLEALAIARERKHLKGGDRARQDNCRQLIINIGKKLATITTLTNYSDILNSFDGMYTSNINKTTITNLVKMIIENPNFEIIEQSVDGVDGKGTGRLGQWGEIWTLDPKMDTVEAASNKINEVLNEK